ncbi:MAG: hypothetical protein WD341_06210 [Tistlia sp.]|uniref:hypothetical protein n=1 Tax=Tistlia sp. TaxID=3057121 RepID=UPI0034A1865E
MAAPGTWPCPVKLDPARWRQLDDAAQRRILGLPAAPMPPPPSPAPVKESPPPPTQGATAEARVLETMRALKAEGRRAAPGAVALALGYSEARTPTWIRRAFEGLVVAGKVAPLLRRDGLLFDAEVLGPAGDS